MTHLIRVFAELRANSNEDGRRRMSRLLLAGELVGALTDHSVDVVVRIDENDNRYEVEALGHVPGPTIEEAMQRFAVVLDVGIKEGVLLSYGQEDWTPSIIDASDEAHETEHEREGVTA